MKKLDFLKLSSAGWRWIVALTAVFFILLTARVQETPTANPASRFATVDALVHDGTYVINGSRFRGTIDKIKVGEDFYSSKPPIVATYTAAVYWVYLQVTGNSLRDQDWRPAVAHLNFLVSVLPYFILVFYFLQFLRLTMRDEKALLIAFSVFLINCLAGGYATDLNNHSPAAIVLFVAFYYAYLLGQRLSDRTQHWVICALMCGLLPAFEIPGALVSGCIFIYLFLIDSRRALQLFIPIALLPVLANQTLGYIATGSLIPSYFRPELYQYPGSYWARKLTGIDGLHEPKPLYLFHMLLGHHGILAMTPVFFFGIYKLVEQIRSKGREYRESILILGSFVALVFLYMLKTRNYGGVCVGFRWMVFFMPLLFIPVSRWIEENFQRLKPLFLLCVFLGFLTFNKASIIPWSTSNWHRLFQVMKWSDV